MTTSSPASAQRERILAAWTSEPPASMSTRSRQASTWIRRRSASAASAAMSATLAVMPPFTGAASAAGPVDGVVGAEGIAGDDRRAAAGALVADRLVVGRADGRGLLLVVLLLAVHLPHVVDRAGHDVLDREHRGVHRVVLVVVAVHAVAADRVHVGGAVGEPLAHALHVGLVAVVVEGVRLRDPHHVPGLDRRRGDQTDLAQLGRGEGDQVLVGHGPGLVTLEHEVLHAQAGAAFLDQVGRPGAEVLDAPDL